MAVINTTAVTNVLKRVYGDRITNLFARQKQAYNHFDKSTRKSQYMPGGAGYYFALRRSDIESVGARVEDAYLPEPLSYDAVQGYIKPRLMYATLRLSGLAIESGKTNVQAFASIQGDAVMSTYQSLVTDLNRMTWGDGYGKLGVLSSSATPATGATWTAKFDNDLGVRYIRKGMICDFYASGGAIDQSASAVRVDSINPATRVVTFEAVGTDGKNYRTYHPNTAAQSYTKAASAIPTSSQLVRYGARDAAFATTDTSREMMGLLGMFDDGTLITTFEGVSTTTYPEFVANVLSNGGVNRELTIDLMLAACDLTSTRSEKTVGRIWMGLGQRRKYFALLSPDVRYAPAQYVGGYESLRFSQDAGIEIRIDPVCQPNRVFFEPANEIKKYELTGIGWGGNDEQRFHWRENYDQATAFLRIYTELGVEDRRSLTVIEDLTEPAGGSTGTMPF